jgi:hypothetical protein
MRATRPDRRRQSCEIGNLLPQRIDDPDEIAAADPEGDAVRGGDGNVGSSCAAAVERTGPRVIGRAPGVLARLGALAGIGEIRIDVALQRNIARGEWRVAIPRSVVRRAAAEIASVD